MSDSVEDILSHYGIKGMRWGHSKNNSPTNVTIAKTPKDKIKTSSGLKQPTHPDAIVAKVAIQKAKKSGIESLSNNELRQLSKRLELERKVSTLAGDDITSFGEQLLKIWGFDT